MLEKKLEQKVVKFCKKRGLYCRKFTSPSNRGVPDRIICGKGRVMFLELKSPGNKPTVLQQHELDTLTGHQMIAVWADNIDRVVELIDDHFFIAPDLIG